MLTFTSMITSPNGSGMFWNSSHMRAPFAASWGVRPASLTAAEAFLGGLLLSALFNCYRQFGTFPIGIFLSNLDSRQLETSLMTYWGVHKGFIVIYLRCQCDKSEVTKTSDILFLQNITSKTGTYFGQGLSNFLTFSSFSRPFLEKSKVALSANLVAKDITNQINRLTSRSWYFAKYTLHTWNWRI